MFIITVPDALETPLKVRAAQYNGAQGTDLTVEEWSLTVLMDMAIQEDLQKALPTIEAARDKGFNDALAAERTRLLAELKAQFPAAPAPLTGPGGPV